MGLQGSVLGPLLFNLFINDLFLVVANCDVCNYADDNSLAVSDISIKEIISKLTADIMNLEYWFKKQWYVTKRREVPMFNNRISKEFEK